MTPRTVFEGGSVDERQPSETPEGRPTSRERVSALLVKSWDDGEAAIIRQLLVCYGIPCQVVSDVSHSLFPLSIDGLGEIRILVPPSWLREAQTLLADHRRQGLRVVRGGKLERGREAEPGAVDG